MFGKNALLFFAILTALVAYKFGNIYVIEGFENPTRYKFGNLILTAIAKIVSNFVFECKLFHIFLF